MIKRKKYKKIESLYSVKENKNQFSQIGTSKIIDREKYKIVVIDDEGFSGTVFSKYNYNKVTTHTTFESISSYAKYDIILCDIQGIGESVQSKHGGVEVAIQLKKQYPQKIVALYSGKERSNIKLDYKNLDGYLDKSLSGSELVSKIDEMISKNEDPVLAWEKIEKDLRDLQIKNKEIAILEDIFCRSLNDYKNYFQIISEYNINRNTLKMISKSIIIISSLVEIILESKQ